MKNSIIIFAIFIAGIIIGRLNIINNNTLSIADYTLYMLMILVGISAGLEGNLLAKTKNYGWIIIIVPFVNILGTLILTLIFSITIHILPIKESLLINSGMGYYSLSSILIEKIHSHQLSIITLIANITRELLTLIFTPSLVKYFGKLSPIAAGGVTTMDTTLPIITKYSGKEYYIISVINGIVLTIIVPFLIWFTYSIY